MGNAFFACIIVLLLTLTVVKSTLAEVSFYADYDNGYFSSLIDGVYLDNSDQQFPVETKYSGDVNAVSAGAFVYSPAKTLFGAEYSYSNGTVSTVRTLMGKQTEYLTAVTMNDAQVFIGYKLEGGVRAALRAGYGYQKINMQDYLVYNKQTTFNYLFVGIRDDILKYRRSSIQADIQLRYNFLVNYATWNNDYSNQMFADSIKNSFGFYVALPVEFGIGSNIALEVAPWYWWTERGLGDTEYKNTNLYLANQSFSQYGMSIGATVSF